MEDALGYWIGAVLLIGLGLSGLVLPAIPGAPLIFAGLVLAAWAESFKYIGHWTIVVLAVLAILTYGVDGCRVFLAGAPRR